MQGVRKAVVLDIDDTITSRKCTISSKSHACQSDQNFILLVVEMAAMANRRPPDWKRRLVYSTARRKPTTHGTPERVTRSLREISENDQSIYTFPKTGDKTSEAVANNKVSDLNKIANKEGIACNKNVILVDDNIANCEAARLNDFTAIHVPVGGIDQDTVNELKKELETSQGNLHVDR